MYSQKFNKGISAFSPETQKALLDYSWPGNIRELINAVERAVILAQDEEVQPEDLALRLGIGPSSKKAGKEEKAAKADVSNVESDGAPRLLSEMERKFIAEALERHNWEIKDAANDIGLTAAALNKKIKEHQLEP
jgi:DNA-binding NtrC family response regulator